MFFRSKSSPVVAMQPKTNFTESQIYHPKRDLSSLDLPLFSVLDKL